MWNVHNEGGVKIAERQDELYPLQRRFIELALDEYGPSESDIPNV